MREQARSDIMPSGSWTINAAEAASTRQEVIPINIQFCIAGLVWARRVGRNERDTAIEPEPDAKV